MAPRKVMRPTLAWLLVAVLALSACQAGAPTQVSAELVSQSGAGVFDPVAQLQAEDSEGFAHAVGDRSLVFPADFGAHNEFQTEWWYYTGNLESASGRHFGFQLTFFRRALLPPDQRQPRQSSWDATQAYMAHFALTDTASRRHIAFERLSRSSPGLAGAQAEPFLVWLEDWQVEETGTNQYRLYAAQDGIRLDLALDDLKGPILQGDAGYSRKGPEPGNASYYFSQTRLQAQGSLSVAGQSYDVSGFAWMDHEFSTSALSQDQVGWDWFSLQLTNDTELMLFQIRRDDGSIDPFSSGVFVDTDGSTLQLSREDFQIEALDTWRSPATRARYPARWRIAIPSLELSLELIPYLADQELDLAYAYWEGAVSVRGSLDGADIQGNGYVEMTGYSGSMAGEF